MNMSGTSSKSFCLLLDLKYLINVLYSTFASAKKLADFPLAEFKVRGYWNLQGLALWCPSFMLQAYVAFCLYLEG